MTQDNSLVPQEPQRPDNRSIEVTRVFLHKGESVTRSLWVKVSPRHPLLKLVLAPFVIAAALAAFVLILLVVIIAVLVLSILWTVQKPRRRKAWKR